LLLFFKWRVRLKRKFFAEIGAEIGCYFIVIFVKMLLNNVCGGAVVGLSLLESLDCSRRCIKKTKKNAKGKGWRRGRWRKRRRTTQNPFQYTPTSFLASTI